MTDLVVYAWKDVVEGAIRWLPVFVLACLAVRLLKNRPARERCAVWVVALASLAAMPAGAGRVAVGSIVVPPVLTSLLEPGPDLTLPGSASAVVTAGAMAEPTPVFSGSSIESREEPAGESGSAMAPRPVRPSSDPPTWLNRAGLVWAVVAMLALLYELLALATTGVLSRGARAVGPDDLPAGLGMDNGDPAVLCGGTEIPILIGIRRPRILLPIDWPCWPETWVRAVILHERAHARRRDVAVLAAARLVRAVFWFHPGAWVAVRQLGREAERATDERVLRSGMNPFDYADALLGLARHLGGRRIPLTGIAMAARAGIHDRLVRIARTDPLRQARAQRSGVLAATAPIALISLLAAAPAKTALPAMWLEQVRLADGGTLWQAQCPPTDHACDAMVSDASRLLQEIEGGGAVAIQEVATGRVAAYAFVDRVGGLPPMPAVPVSAVAGLPLAAAWWEAGLGDRTLPCPGVLNVAGAGSLANTNGLDTGSIRVPADVLALQCATAAIAMGSHIAREIGQAHLSSSFSRWGFAAGPQEPFWSGNAAPEPDSPVVPDHPLGDGSVTWIVAGSVHGTVHTTLLHITRFLQAVGNRGVMTRPVPPTERPSGASIAYMNATTADDLLSAMVAARSGGRGGQGADPRLVGILGPGMLSVGGEASDVFAGLLLGDDATPLYSVAVWLPRGRIDDGARARPGASRTLAQQLLTTRR